MDQLSPEIILSIGLYKYLWTILTLLIVSIELDFLPSFCQPIAFVIGLILTPDSIVHPSFYFGLVTWIILRDKIGV